VDASAIAASAEESACDEDASVTTKGQGLARFGYRSTQPVGVVPGYGGEGGKPMLGTAMAASGAAISPDMGYHSRPGVAALLAIFNVRLGWWTGNPRNRKTWKEYAPSIYYLLAEMFGETNDDAKYAYLSDGGHFENLGLYELVRRKVRFIICSDAAADGRFQFEDLGNAIERCRCDFGVEIKLSAQLDLMAGETSPFRAGHYSIGEIKYPGQKQKGVLLYLKSSLTNDEPSDVLGMRASDQSFPHDTTAQQFFTESMFEAYRALGQHMMEGVLTRHLDAATAKGPHEKAVALYESLRSAYVKEQKQTSLRAAM
jgi:hypothetical protein